MIGRESRRAPIGHRRFAHRARMSRWGRLHTSAAGPTIGDGCELGNYAEVKNSVLGAGVKMHHFSYIGDADVGDYTNVGAGSITCNYDGVQKHRTTIGNAYSLGATACSSRL